MESLRFVPVASSPRGVLRLMKLQTRVCTSSCWSHGFLIDGGRAQKHMSSVTNPLVVGEKALDRARFPPPRK